MQISPLAGKPARKADLIDVAKLICSYYVIRPDPEVPTQRVIFGTSGHRGCAYTASFNEAHVLAICQALCDYRRMSRINGPLFLGMDTHALSGPACETAIEVLAGNGVRLMLAPPGEFTPTPVVSFAILQHNRYAHHNHGIQNYDGNMADGIVITPSHNPPKDGGIKYNLPQGGPASAEATGWIARRANQILRGKLVDVCRLPLSAAMAADTTCQYDYLTPYVESLDQVVAMNSIREAGLRIGVDPLGGAGIHYWDRIAQRYSLNLTITNSVIDPTFKFLTVDWDGEIRTDPSSVYAMQGLVSMKGLFDIAFACDADHDRHGIVTPGAGLMPANHYLVAAIAYLFTHREQWNRAAGIGKSVVTTGMIDILARHLERPLIDMPVGFKWFADGLYQGTLGFAGEESAGAAFLRRDGSVWTTEKDGITSALLAAEMTACTGMDPGQLYRQLTSQYGNPAEQRTQMQATFESRQQLAIIDVARINGKTVAGEMVVGAMNRAPGNDAALGGFKVSLDHAWFAARPSGTEDIIKIYAESFEGTEHVNRVLEDAQALVHELLTEPVSGQ